MMCYALTLAAAVALGQTPANPDRANARKIDGQWEVVYVEMDGKTLNPKEFTNVSISNNKLSSTHEGKQKDFQLNFGLGHRVKAECLDKETPAEKRQSHGVYIAGKNVLCFSMNHGKGDPPAAEKGAPRTDDAVASGDGTQHGAYGTHFVLILRRPGNVNQ
jgi:uncharacterized protein (TIGR03067 family)